MSAALKLLAPVRTPEVGRTINPSTESRIQGKSRQIACDKLREMIAGLESGDLDGAGFYWRDDDGPETEMVTVDIRPAWDGVPGSVSMNSLVIEEV